MKITNDIIALSTGLVVAAAISITNPAHSADKGSVQYKNTIAHKLPNRIASVGVITPIDRPRAEYKRIPQYKATMHYKVTQGYKRPGGIGLVMPIERTQAEYKRLNEYKSTAPNNSGVAYKRTYGASVVGVVMPINRPRAEFEGSNHYKVQQKNVALDRALGAF